MLAVALSRSYKEWSTPRHTPDARRGQRHPGSSCRGCARMHPHEPPHTSLPSSAWKWAPTHLHQPPHAGREVLAIGAEFGHRHAPLEAEVVQQRTAPVWGGVGWGAQVKWRTRHCSKCSVFDCPGAAVRTARPAAGAAAACPSAPFLPAVPPCCCSTSRCTQRATHFLLMSSARPSSSTLSNRDPSGLTHRVWICRGCVVFVLCYVLCCAVFCAMSCCCHAQGSAARGPHPRTGTRTRMQRDQSIWPCTPLTSKGAHTG